MHIEMEPTVRLLDYAQASSAQPENPFYSMVGEQRLAIVSVFELESGQTLRQAPVAFKTWGTLNASGDNVMVICHALSGSADVADWWAPLLGQGRAFDHTRFFIFCGNVLGSPYGSASPCTLNPDTGAPYGADFPHTSIRDDVRIHKLVLDALGVSQVAVCIGGSMGGMQTLEWAACFGPRLVRHIIPIATCGRHSAWGISWGETQRRTIESDPKFRNGRYTREDPPNDGLSAARMAAMLTYRSRDSFEARFGRRRMESGGNAIDASNARASSTPARAVFSAQSYLRYQGTKFCTRFDANCYMAITRKMDTHDLARGRGDYVQVLAGITQPALVLGVESDGLFTINEQYELSDLLPDAEMSVIQSPDGHDGFLLEFDQLNRFLLRFLRRCLPELVSPETENDEASKAHANTPIKATKSSLFGEAEVDVISW